MRGSPQKIRPTEEQREEDPGDTDPADGPIDQSDDQTGSELIAPQEFNPNS
ncbi:MAG: hypothetical protein IKG46_10550 [Solobacterium sp.]|nr:hypothetical protein [Oscillospiraceae bacterium]MBR3358247.1 hypothetical protein [Solobacterium sp.]